ncbi:CatB-related O-acetyltransferase [Sinorhizobium meliloti]|uniref:CatB-related O-acetyltransferase n=2 Tax=Rhizobium meliloti TaxID=382 RepID=UPI000FD8FD96|nr:CatB-related O-acetyltransferase [Sinorhizobium meliloti]RVG91352.1 antibiotic acetyltransferase [Sinorhizobium meliloti]
MQIKVTAEHIDYLRENKIFLNADGTYNHTWMRIGAVYNTYGAALLEPYSAMSVGPRLCSIGAFSYSKSYFPPQYFTIGRYCAIAMNSQAIPDNHPMERLGMCGFDYAKVAPFKQFETDVAAPVRKVLPKADTAKTIIGNDVWIGQDVLIKRGVTIGHGAVVGARSIVTKDVPPYAIVIGSPATFKRWRFDELLIERLLASNWWDYSYDQFVGMDTTDPLDFLPAFEDAKAAGRLRDHPEARIDVHAAFRMIAQKTA